MTSTHTQEMLSSAKDFSEDLISIARKDVAKKLQAVDEACREIIKNEGTVSIKSVRGWLVTNRAVSIAPSTLMNLRTDPRTGTKRLPPARRIIDKYIDVQKSVSRRSPKSSEPQISPFFINEPEMKDISDHQVRYKVQLLIGHVRNLETQLNHVRTISNLPALPAENALNNKELNFDSHISHAGETVSPILNSEEQEALDDFLNVNSMQRRKIGFDDNGVLKASHPASPKSSTTAISKPFLEGALRKILGIYGQDIFSK